MIQRLRKPIPHPQKRHFACPETQEITAKTNAVAYVGNRIQFLQEETLLF